MMAVKIKSQEYFFRVIKNITIIVAIMVVAWPDGQEYVFPSETDPTYFHQDTSVALPEL